MSQGSKGPRAGLEARERYHHFRNGRAVTRPGEVTCSSSGQQQAQDLSARMSTTLEQAWILMSLLNRVQSHQHLVPFSLSPSTPAQLPLCMLELLPSPPPLSCPLSAFSIILEEARKGHERGLHFLVISCHSSSFYSPSHPSHFLPLYLLQFPHSSIRIRPCSEDTTRHSSVLKQATLLWAGCILCWDQGGCIPMMPDS